jgi:hypothetical protein
MGPNNGGNDGLRIGRIVGLAGVGNIGFDNVGFGNGFDVFGLDDGNEVGSKLGLVEKLGT